MRTFWMCCVAVVISAVVIVVVTDPRPAPVAAPLQTPAAAPETLSFGDPVELPDSSEPATPRPTTQALAPNDSAQAPRVLFVGNSFTLSNDLPGTVDIIAAANNTPLDIGVEAKFGFSLAAHLAQSHALDTLHNQAWDTVVIQELSVNPAHAELFATYTQPAVEVFAETANEVDTSIMFFQTWGHRDGNAEIGQPGYGPMQRSLIENYETLATRHQALVAPVGEAWATTMATYPELDLYAADGVHPSAAGSYLAALVLARSLTDAPLTQAPNVGITAELAARLLDIANAATS